MVIRARRFLNHPIGCFEAPEVVGSYARRQRSPALRSGEYYQAWLKNSAGALVPIETFSSSDGRVTLWSVVSPKDVPTIT